MQKQWQPQCLGVVSFRGKFTDQKELKETKKACVWRVQRNLQNGNGHQDKGVKAGLTASGNVEQKDGSEPSHNKSWRLEST